MGSSSSKNQIQKIDHDLWTAYKIENGVEIVRSTKGDQKDKAQIRVIGLDPKHEIPKQKSIYTYRKNTDAPLVKVLAAEFEKSERKTLCGNQQNVKVMTERIPWRLDDIKNLTHSESLYILSQSLQGFQDLHQKAGIFDITERMVGFNEQGEVKVWLNENFAQNHPISQRPILQTTMTSPESYLTGVSGEQRMVETLVYLVQNKCSQNGLHSELDNALSTRSKSFADAFQCVQEHIDTKNLPVPNKIEFVGRNPNGGINLKQGQTIRQSSPFINETAEERRNSGVYRSNQPIQFGRVTEGNHYGHGPTVPAVEIGQSGFRVARSTQPVYITTNLTGGNSYGITSMRQPYHYGVISRPLSPRPAGSPKSISFNYQSPNVVLGGLNARRK